MGPNRPSTLSPVPEAGEEQSDLDADATGKIILPRPPSQKTLPPSDEEAKKLETKDERALRIALDNRRKIGHRTILKGDGTKIDASGIWGVLEPMVEDWERSKRRQRGILGFLAKPFERIVDTLVLVALALGFAYASSRYTQCSSLREAQQAVPVPVPVGTSK